jgi:transcriptional regulator with XRE-family HTH domain
MDQGLERHQLRVQLRQYREQSGLSQREVAQGLGWSASKVHRIEAGTSPITESDLRSLLARYSSAAEDEVAQLLLLARSARQNRAAPLREPGPPSVRRYLDYEAAAVQIWNFEPMFVPGLLQTPDYTRALLSRVGLPNASAGTKNAVDRALTTRRYRQEILHRTPPVRLHVLIDESAIERQIGGPRVMTNQLEHLWAMSERTNVLLGIVPLAAGAYPAMRSPFVVMRFAEPAQPELLFLEDPITEIITLGDDTDDAGPTSFREAFDEIWNLAHVGRDAAERLRTAWRAASGSDISPENNKPS